MSANVISPLLGREGVTETTLAWYLDRYESLRRTGFCDGPRYQIAYDVLGEGPPIYVVTGICSTRRLMAPVLVELAKNFRVVAYDLAGVRQGDGAKMAEDRHEAYPDDLFAMMDHLDDAEAPVASFSFGTTVTVRAMATSSRIPRAMLIGGFAYRPLSTLERWALGVLRHWPAPTTSAPFEKMVSRYNHGPELDAREPGLIDFLIEENQKVRIGTTAAQILAVSRVDIRPLLRQVRQPVLVIHGERDRLVPVSHAGDLAKSLANVRIMLIPSGGHILQLSHPELIAHAAVDFFHAPDADLITSTCPRECPATAMSLEKTPPLDSSP